MTIRLRPHHLLCMLTYVGKGYGEWNGLCNSVMANSYGGMLIQIKE